LFAPRGPIVDWLRQSLRRWLVVPIVVATFVLAVIAAVFGTALIDQLLTQVQVGSLHQDSIVAASVITDRAAAMAQVTQRAAELSAARGALSGDQPSTVGPELAVLAQGLGIQTISFVPASGASVVSFDVGAGREMPTGWAPSWLFDPAVEIVWRGMLGNRGAAGAQVGMVSAPSGAIVYAVGPVVSGNTVQGLVVTGLPLQSAFQGVSGALDGSLAVYDMAGQPIYGAVEAGGPPPGPWPVAPAHGEFNGPSLLPTDQQANVDGRLYYGALTPITLDGQNQGYAALWRSAAPVRALIWRWQAVFLACVLASAAIILALTSRLSRSVVQPVEGLVEAAGAVARGEYERAVPPMAIGQLSILAHALERMAKQVRQQTDALREQARQSTYLFEASAELGRTLDLEESAETAAEAIFGLGDISYVVILTGRNELGPFTAAAVRGLPPEVAAQVHGHEYPVPLSGVMARALVGRQPVVIEDVAAQSRPRSDEFNWDTSSGSMLLYPVCSASGPFALLIVGSGQAGALARGRLGDLVFALASIASHSIQNAQLYGEAIRSQEQMVTLQAISRLVTSTARIEDVLDVVTREAADIIGDSQAWLYLKEAETTDGRLHGRPRGTEGWGAVHQDAVSWVMRAGQPIFFNPALPLVASPILVHSGPAMCVPLEAESETLGAMMVASRKAQRAFVEDDMIVLRTLANAAAAALHTRILAQRFTGGYLELAQAWGSHAADRIGLAPGHAYRVAQNAAAIAAAAGLPPDLISALQVAGFLHDVAGDGAAEDTQLYATADTAPHASAGADWLARSGLDSRVVALVRYHHTARPDLSIADADLGRAAAALVLAHAVDNWLAGSSTQPPLTVSQVRVRLASAAGGGPFAPSAVEICSSLLDERRWAVP